MNLASDLLDACLIICIRSFSRNVSTVQNLAMQMEASSSIRSLEMCLDLNIECISSKRFQSVSKISPWAFKSS